MHCATLTIAMLSALRGLFGATPHENRQPAAGAERRPLQLAVAALLFEASRTA
jgi:hypothetical protein